MMTKTPRRRRATPTFLQVALRPYRRGEPERHIMIATRTIQSVLPLSVITCTNLATEETTQTVADPRYGVSFRNGRTLEHGRATRADLIAAGIPVPPGYS